MLLEQLDADCDAGLWTWFPLSETIVSAATTKYRSLTDTISLRASDAIHLVCAADLGLAEIFTNDRHVRAAAPHFGLTVAVIT